MRLHKYMSECGVASRRASEKMIKEGRVKVNERVVTKLGVDIDPSKDCVVVDNSEIKRSSKRVYIAFNKPAKVITTMKEQFQRDSIMEYIGDIGHRVFPVGRLDYGTEGLLILTDDGELANKLMHPKFEVDKVYTARVRGKLGREEISSLESGVKLDGKMTAPAELKVLDSSGPFSIVRIVIHEGRNRQVRRMFETVECKVEFLRRDSVGSIKLGELPIGRWRYLNDAEIKYLFEISGIDSEYER